MSGKRNGRSCNARRLYERKAAALWAVVHARGIDVRPLDDGTWQATERAGVVILGEPLPLIATGPDPMSAVEALERSEC